MKKSRSFTLFEIVVVLALIALVASLGFGGIHGLLKKERFYSQVERLKSLLEELQIEALALGSDMEVEIVKQDVGWKARSQTAESILRSQTVSLKTVETITMNGIPIDHLKMTIFATGTIEPKALLEVKQSDHAVWIDLRQPIQIKFSQQKPKDVRLKHPQKPQEKKDEAHQLRI